MALGDIRASYSSSYYIGTIDFFDNARKAAMSDDLDAVIWDIENNVILTRVTHPNVVNEVKVSNDETMVISCDNDSVIVWDIETGDIITTFTDHTNYIKKVTITNDDTRVVSASGSEIHVWEIETKNILTTFSDYSTALRALDVSPDDTMVACGGYDEDVQIWDINTGELLHSFSGHTSYIFTVEFHPDGDRILSCSYDNTIKVWDFPSGDILHEFTQHTDRVNSCQFFPDGNRVISGGDDCKIFIWDLTDDSVMFSKDSYMPYKVEAVACNEKGSKIAVGYGYNAEVIELIDPGGLVLANKYGQVYNNDPNFLPVPLSLGRVLITEASDVYEVQFQNNKELPVKNVNLTTNNEKTGTDLTFSKTLSPFDDLQSVTYAGPYEPGALDTFYIRLNTDLEAAKGKDSLIINADAEFAY